MTRESLDRLLRIVRPKVEAEETLRVALLVEGPLTTAARVWDTPTKSVCYAFKKRTCTRGAACSYPHDKAERSSSARPRTQHKSTKQCTFFQSGTCKFGEQCHDLHGGNDRNASPKRKPKGKSKGDQRPAAAAVAISVLAESPASILKVYVSSLCQAVLLLPLLVIGRR